MPILDIPLISQWGIPSDERYRNDCGPACVAMILEYYGKRDGLTADDLAVETPLVFQDTGLFPISLVKLLARHNVASRVSVGTTLDMLKTEIDARRPVIALIQYGYILDRLDRQDVSGHFVLVEGYDDTHVVIDDPDVWVPYLDKGHNQLVPVAQLERAMDVYSGQCVFVEVAMTLAQQITQLAKQIEALAAQIDSTPPVPSTPPPEVIDEMVVNAPDGLIVHTAPSHLAARIDKLADKTPVAVLGSTVETVYHYALLVRVNGLKYPTTGYVAREYLVPKA